MNCCNTNEKSEYSNNIEKVKGGKSIKMERKTWLWIIIGILFLLVLFLVFKVGTTGNVVQSAGSAAQSVASSGMVGGC